MKSNKFILYFISLVTLFVVFLNLGHFGVPRQGTEGFYLKILKEMADQNSFLTPLYLGAPHWSKPPFHFWIGFPFVSLFHTTAIYGGRLAVLLLTFSSLYLITKTVTRLTQFNWKYLFIFLLSSFGTIKFFRIYMMEIPLSLGITLSAYLFYLYLNQKDLKVFAFAVLAATCTTLVKGPVSIAIIFGGIGLYYLVLAVRTKKIFDTDFIIKTTLFLVSTLILSSLWFLVEYAKFGQEFINYFFIRENFGKFATKHYPAIVLFQGLLMYIIPWPFFLRKRHLLRIKKLDDFQIFSLSMFFVSFLIWFIPTQRSHHYAMPSLYFFLIFLFTLYNQDEDFFNSQSRLLQMPVLILAILSLLFSIIIFNYNSNLAYLLSALIVTCASLLYFYSQQNRRSFALSFFVLFTFIWYGQTSLISLPPVSNEAESFLLTRSKDEVIYLIHRKPLFVEEFLSRKIEVIDQNEMSNLMPEQLIIAPHDQVQANSQFEILYSWPIWKRGISVSEVWSALSSRNYEPLYLNYALAQRASQ